MHKNQLRSLLYIIKILILNMLLTSAFQCIIKTLNDEWEMGLYKHYKMDFWIKFRCARHKNFVQKYLSKKNAAHIKNASESLWDTRSKLMHRHALFPSIVSHTSFSSLHNCPTLWPSFKIFPWAAIFHCIRNKHWTEFSFKVSWKFEDIKNELNEP